MNTIWKYPLEFKERQIVKLPAKHELLCVKDQRGIPALWALVDPEDHDHVQIAICTLTTGNSGFPTDGMMYLGTVLLNEDRLVFHYFAEDLDANYSI